MGRTVSMSEATYHILAALLASPLHGYGIIKRAEELSGGRVRLAVGTLYGALDRMARDGLVAVDREETVGGRPRRYFRITDEGVRAVAEEAARMERAAEIVRGRLRAPRTGTAPA
ncbi:PadR family transcriptional regulator [Actinomadura sp. LOL_016]|uniref:PadR family transcriptional regulator n=1 Tax=unclassified Actinomadura TaxID=2626254 RepID=UPI003A812A14